MQDEQEEPGQVLQGQRPDVAGAQDAWMREGKLSLAAVVCKQGTELRRQDKHPNNGGLQHVGTGDATKASNVADCGRMRVVCQAGASEPEKEFAREVAGLQTWSSRVPIWLIPHLPPQR